MGSRGADGTGRTERAPLQITRDSDALYRSLFTLAPSGVVLLDGEGRILEFNDQAHEQLGYTREEFARLSISDLHLDEPPEDVRARIRRVVDSGHGDFEVRHRTKAGEIRNVLVRSRSVRDEHGTFLLAVWQDVTERKRTEEALRRSERLLRAFSDSIPDPVFLKDRGGRWLFANPAALAMIGKPAEQVLGRTDAEIYDDPRAGESILRTDRRIMDSGAAEVVEESIPTPTGARLFLSTKVPYRDADGHVVGIMGSARDITDRKRAELVHETRERYLQTILQTALDGFYVVDRDGRLLEVNDAYCAMSGYSRDELLQMRVSDLEAIEDEHEVSAHVEKIMRAGSDRFESRHRRKDGGLIDIEASVTFVDHGGGRRNVCFVRDVTARKQAEERARQAQKMESIGRLAGGVAHDFNNLLTVILGCADALQDEVGRRAPSYAKDVEDITAAATQARDLTRQLLSFSRRQVIAPATLDLNEVVRGTEPLLRRVLGEDVALAVDLQPGLWAARCDRGQIEQVIMNLVVNARDAMPDGGTLVIETRNADADVDACGRSGPHASLTVRDSGVGMSREVRAHLFEPFFTTKPRGRGTGLGLATVYAIVQQCDGHIHVDSELGHGTTVKIAFPRVTEVPVPDPVRSSTTPAKGTETLLVVEDEPLVRDITVRSLRAGGYRILVASNGREALELSPAELERVSLVITDVIMPGMDGSALAAELQRRYPRLRVLFVSGYSDDRLAHCDPGIELLPKPFTPASLLARVRAMIDRS